MTWFIFIGDMLVMLFMTCVVVWVAAGANRETLDYSARIPLDDDGPARATVPGKEQSNG